MSREDGPEYPEADAYKQPTRWRVMDRRRVSDIEVECRLACGHWRKRHQSEQHHKFMECPLCINSGRM